MDARPDVAIQSALIGCGCRFVAPPQPGPAAHPVSDSRRKVCPHNTPPWRASSDPATSRSPTTTSPLDGFRRPSAPAGWAGPASPPPSTSRRGFAPTLVCRPSKPNRPGLGGECRGQGIGRAKCSPAPRTAWTAVRSTGPSKCSPIAGAACPQAELSQGQRLTRSGRSGKAGKQTFGCLPRLFTFAGSILSQRRNPPPKVVEHDAVEEG